MVEDRGQLVLDQRHLALMLRDFGEDVFGDAPSLLFLQSLQCSSTKGRILDVRDEVVRSERLVPKLQSLHLAEFGHGFAVGSHAGIDGVTGAAVTQGVVSARHDEARRQTFDIPLPGCWKRLVEVVD